MADPRTFACIISGAHIGAISANCTFMAPINVFFSSSLWSPFSFYVRWASLLPHHFNIKPRGARPSLNGTTRLQALCCYDGRITITCNKRGGLGDTAPGTLNPPHSVRAGKHIIGGGEGSPHLMFPKLEGRRRMEVIVVSPRIYSTSILLSGNRFGA